MKDFQTMEEKCAESYQCSSWIVKELGKNSSLGGRKRIVIFFYLSSEVLQNVSISRFKGQK